MADKKNDIIEKLEIDPALSIEQKIDVLNSEIKKLQDRLKDVKGQVTEIYTRIVGYYRAIKNWNLGKQEEFKMRVTYKEPEKIPEKSHERR